MQRRMRLGDVMTARGLWPNHVSWCAIFMKAYAIVSAERPELRRCFMRCPWGHLYEHPGNIAALTVERMYQGEPAVFVAHIPRPEIVKLGELDATVRQHKTAPIESVETFRRQLWISGYPTMIRRPMWWSSLNVDGLLRAKVFGTFGVSSVASFGSGSLHVLSPLTTTLNFGTFTDDGEIDMRLTYDHRVLDGATIARALAAMEETLHDLIAPELADGAPEEEYAYANRNGNGKKPRDRSSRYK